jgi:hypothetical protein
MRFKNLKNKFQSKRWLNFGAWLFLFLVVSINILRPETLLFPNTIKAMIWWICVLFVSSLICLNINEFYKFIKRYKEDQQTRKEYFSTSLLYLFIFITGVLGKIIWPIILCVIIIFWLYIHIQITKKE